VHQEADEGPVITMLCKMAIWRYQIRNAVPGHFPHTPTPANASESASALGREPHQLRPNVQF
jgi:hypothetical protein